MEMNMRIHPDDEPMFQKRSKPDVARKGGKETESEVGVVAKADLALHKSGCRGLCGLSFSEPEEYLTVYITSKARVADALKVVSLPTPPPDCKSSNCIMIPGDRAAL